MRVLMAFNRDLNPYVDVLASGLDSAGCRVDMGTEKFWDAEQFDYDIVHIQWPETLFDWRVPSAIEMRFLKRRLREVHQQAKIVFTRHNEVSHHVRDDNGPILTELYGLLESECDVMVHLGEASLNACRTRPELAGKRHCLIPIPVYDELYAPYLNMDRAEARRVLGISPSKKVVLAFGNFRYPQEKHLVMAAIAGQRDGRVRLIAPKWHKASEYSFSPRHPMLALRSTRKFFWAWLNRMKLGCKKIISDEEVARYFTAADVVLIQRVEDLNSGNIPMAFLFGKTVVGPDSGNIGDWLRKTGNVAFDATRSESVCSGLSRALALSETGLGAENHRFAMENWSTQCVGALHAELYKSVCAT